MCIVWSMSHQGPNSCPFSPSSLCVAAALLDVLIELAPNQPKLGLSASVPVLQQKRLVSRAAARVGLVGCCLSSPSLACRLGFSEGTECFFRA